MVDTELGGLILLGAFLLGAGILLVGSDWLEGARERNGTPAAGREEPCEPWAFAQTTWRWATCPHADGFSESGDDFIRNVARCRWCGWMIPGPAGRPWPMPPGSSSTWPRPGSGDVAEFLTFRTRGSGPELSLVIRGVTTTDEGVRRYGLPTFHGDVYGDLDPEGDQARWLELEGSGVATTSRGDLARRAARLGAERAAAAKRAAPRRRA